MSGTSRTQFNELASEVRDILNQNDAILSQVAASTMTDANKLAQLSKAVVDFLDEMGHEGCTPHGGCQIAELREKHRQLTIETKIVPVPMTGTYSAPTTVFDDSALARNTSG